MDRGMRGRVVLVTGASEGMGKATVLALAREGVRLALVARSAATLATVAAAARREGADEVLAFPGDLDLADTAAAAVNATLDAFGCIDGLVNTVGLCEVVPEGFLAQDDGYWERSFSSVLMAAVRTCRAAIPSMLERASGTIVNTSAMSARHYLPMLAHYSSQKLALAHLTKNLAKEFGDRGIRTNAVMPGMIESDGVARRKAATMAREGWNDDAQFFEYVNDKYDHCAYGGRLGQPGEVAAAIVWLLSDQSSYVNGAWLPVDGGSPF